MKNSILAAAIATASVMSMNVSANSPEVSASVSASNFYLWRGQNLGSNKSKSAFSGGEAQIAGDLNVSMNGLYAGTWVSSGDIDDGTEVDLYLGYGGESGEFSYDLSYWSYLYPETSVGFGEAAEVVGSVGYGPVSYALYYDASKDSSDRDWTYMTLGAEFGKYGLTIGKHNDSLLHADLSYAYNDNVAFTLVVPLDDNEGITDDPLVNVNLSLPIKF